MTTNRRHFIKQAGMGVMTLGILSSLPEKLYAGRATEFTLPRSTPEKQGMASGDIAAFLDAVEKSKIEFHSFMVIRHGHVVAEGWWNPYASQLEHTLYSLSKSFTSTAVGLAITEGKFTLESPVTSFFPNDLPKDVSPNLAAMQVKHLLTMSTGHAKDTIPVMRAGNNAHWAKAFLELPVEFEPGTHFLYNTGATYMLSAIVQKTTGQPLIEYLNPRLFEPLGIKGMDWETDPQGVNTGGYGLRVKTEDIARFGMLYLQKGKWNGKQLLPQAWVEDATAAHVESSPSVQKRPRSEDDWSQGYGYQFWRCRHGLYRGDGAFGQFCIVFPDQDAVVAITGESFDLQGSMNLVWDHLLPAMKDQPLPAEAAAQKNLQGKLKALTLSPLQNAINAPAAARVSGKPFTLDANDLNAKKIAFAFRDGKCTLTVSDDKGDHTVTCGMNTWITNENYKTQTLFPMPGRPVVATPLVATASWLDDQTLTMTWRFTATAHSDNLTFVFQDNNLTLSFLNSVAKGNPDNVEKRAPLKGQLLV
jgi:CubicO group peptidase (beta-lactamase class C family)